MYVIALFLYGLTSREGQGGSRFFRPSVRRACGRCGAKAEAPKTVESSREPCPLRRNVPILLTPMPLSPHDALFKESFGQAGIARSELEVILPPPRTS